MSVTEPNGSNKTKSRERSRGTQCLNCGLAIETNYCPHCGQHNSNHNHGIGQFFHEFIEEFFHLDSKIVRTLVPLFRKPGFLTQEWISGKRVRYITPLKLYVTLSAFCFLALSLRGTLYGETKSDLKFTVNPPKSQMTYPAAESALDNLFKKKIGKPDQASIEAVKDKFIARLPTTNFILMPVVAGIFSLLYFRSKRFYVEHLVFTLHFYSFVFLEMTVTALLPAHFLISNILRGIGVIWVLAYLPIALVKNFGQGYLKTFLKLGIFALVYAVVLGFALFGTLIATAYALPDRPVAIDAKMPGTGSKN